VTAHRTFVAAALMVALGVAAGCAGYRAEFNGRDLGRHVCDLKSADDSNQAQRAMRRLQSDIDKAQRIVGRPVGNDVSDINKNLGDLVNHASDKQSALARQDVAAIRRNVQQVVAQAPQLTKQFYEGVVEGLGDCI